jgi:hypothetical protein
MLASLAAYELLHQTRQEHTGEGVAAAAAAQRGGGGRGSSVSSQGHLAANQRLVELAGQVINLY